MRQQYRQRWCWINYHLVTNFAQARRDFDAAQDWYLKALAIKEKQNDEHGAAITYGQLGSLAAKKEKWLDAGQAFLKALVRLVRTDDSHYAAVAARGFQAAHGNASDSEKRELEHLWSQAGLGDFPTK